MATEAKKTRIFCIRHIERDKSRTDDPQWPTKGGEIAAFAMGIELRDKSPNFATITSSPQPRAIRTAILVCCGLRGITSQQFPTIEKDSRLNDFSSDERPEIKACIQSAKKHAKLNGLEVEQSAYLTEDGLKGVMIKSDELVSVIDEKAKLADDHMVGGLHGSAIDGAYAKLSQRLSPDVKFGMGAAGSMFDKVEGFIATFEDGKLAKLEMIRQPDYLKALGCLVK